MLDRFDVSDVWGGGGATVRKLAGLGINTAGQLRDMPMNQARALGTVVLERLVAELRGVPGAVVETLEPQRKRMAVTRSFGTPARDFDTVMGALTHYAMRAGEKLRSHGLVAARLTVFFHTNRFKPDSPQFGASRLVLPHPMTNDSLELIAATRAGAEHAWRDGYAITKAGVMLDDLAPAKLRPRTLFEGDTDKEARLMDALDDINGRFGRSSAVPAPKGSSASGACGLTANHPPRQRGYTTCPSCAPDRSAGYTRALIMC